MGKRQHGRNEEGGGGEDMPQKRRRSTAAGAAATLATAAAAGDDSDAKQTQVKTEQAGAAAALLHNVAMIGSDSPDRGHGSGLGGRSSRGGTGRSQKQPSEEDPWLQCMRSWRRLCQVRPLCIGMHVLELVLVRVTT